jgi:hypothetical protein
VLYIMGERDYLEQVLTYAQKASLLTGCSPELWNLIEDARLTHVYLNSTSGPLFPDALRECPQLNLIYEIDGVSIYETHLHGES